MVLQLGYGSKLDRGPVGSFQDTSQNRETDVYTNKDPFAVQEDLFTVDTASDDTDYTVTIEGVDITYSSASTGATKASIADGLADAINSEIEVNGFIDASSDGVDTVTVKGVDGAETFTASESDSNLSHTAEDVSASEADPVPFGRAVVKDGYGQDSPLAKLADESALTKRKLEIAVDSAENSTEYSVDFVKDGQHHEATFTSDASATLDEVVNGLQSALDGLSVSGVTFTADTGNDKVVAESETAGVVDFDVNILDETLLTLSTAQVGDSMDEKMAGVAIRTAHEGNQYPSRDNMTVGVEGRIYVPVESSVSAGDDVFVRMNDNGDNNKGEFLNSYESGAAPLESAEFKEGVDSNLAVIDIDL